MRLALLALVLVACGSGVGVSDAGRVDASHVVDASVDAGAIDASPADGGLTPSPANVGWIGGACESAADCFDVTDATCLRDGYPNGLCSEECRGVCPDRGAPGDATTFCIDGIPHGFTEGICVSRCDPALLPPDGCPDGYRCVEENRYSDPHTVVAACVPEVPVRCPGASDELVLLDYPDRGSVWIPAEAACEHQLDLLVLLHGLNPSNNPTPSLGGGRHLELLVRDLVDAELVRPLVLAEPVHFEASSTTLYGTEFDPAEHLRRVQAILDERDITLRSLSYIGHSGAGCDRNNGLYEVLNRYDDLVGTFAPTMRLWGLMDICYAASYHYAVPLAVLAGRDVVVASMFTTGDTEASVVAFEAGLLASPAPFDCDPALFRSCVRHPTERWCSYRTSTSAPVVHDTNPYFFVREVLPKAFSPSPDVEPCR